MFETQEWLGLNVFRFVYSDLKTRSPWSSYSIIDPQCSLNTDRIGMLLYS